MLSLLNLTLLLDARFRHFDNHFHTWKLVHDTHAEAVDRFVHNEDLYDHTAFEAERLKGIVEKQGDKIRNLEGRLSDAIDLIQLLARRSGGEYTKTLFKNIY